MCIRRRVGGGSELSEIVYISTRLVKSYELGVGIYADNRVDRLLMSCSPHAHVDGVATH